MRTRLTIALIALVAACDPYDPNAVLRQNAPASPPSVQTGAMAGNQQAPATTPEPSERAYRDSDFVESELNRDPFRSYAAELRAKAPIVAQRLVLMPETPIDDMKLIAIVSGIDQPRAMIVDTKGVGYVTTRGDFVGKADVVQGGGSESLPVSLNWRVDRIRDAEVVLAREDPTAPNRPPLTKVIPLHAEPEISAAPPG
jgi:type IV pilus assembly protein PilP